MVTDGFEWHKKWNIEMLPNVAKGGKGLNRIKEFIKIRPNDGPKLKIKTY